MTITSVVVIAASTAERLVIDGYCDSCRRHLSYAEYDIRACWQCQPETRPPDYDERLERARKRSRAKARRGADRPRADTTDDTLEDEA